MPISQIVTNSLANNAVTFGKIAEGAIPEVPQIIKPSITSPANNATGIFNVQLFTATPYLSLYGRSQANAQWQISTSPTFAFINVNSTITGSNTQFQANAFSGIVANTTIHYARVRYSDDANNSSEYSNTIQFTTASAFTLPVEFLVVAGGGGGGRDNFASANRGAGGGGAGGYRTSVGTSGGSPGSAESTFTATPGVSYTLTVGAGGAGGLSGDAERGVRGSNSVFGSITSIGGGGGGGHRPVTGGAGDGSGGSGGGGSNGGPIAGGAGTPGQGFAGTGGGENAPYHGGGGGGAGGTTPYNADASTVGGPGRVSNITNTPTTRGGGGGSRGGTNNANGGPGGGGNGGGGAGTPNTGGGGGGNRDGNGGSGGSGIVILRFANNYTLTASPGLTVSTINDTANGNTIVSFTAGTGTVSFS